jgi:hypothetical protein
MNGLTDNVGPFAFLCRVAGLPVLGPVGYRSRLP